MIRLALLPIALLIACGLAALYGALHNQISYTVSPEYFHALKFIQFDIPLSMQNRLGASWVGVQASWWMGLIIGPPIYLLALCIKGTERFMRGYAWAATAAVIITALSGLVGLGYAFVTLTPISGLTINGVQDPLAFRRAGMMHNSSYLGGMIGLCGGAMVVIYCAARSRRSP